MYTKDTFADILLAKATKLQLDNNKVKGNKKIIYNMYMIEYLKDPISSSKHVVD